MGSEEAARAAPRALRAPFGWEGGGGPGGGWGGGRRPPRAAPPATLLARRGGQRRGSEDKGVDTQALQVAREGSPFPRPKSPPGRPAVLSGQHPRLERVGVSGDRCDFTDTRSETLSGTRFNLTKHVLFSTPRQEKVPVAPAVDLQPGEAIRWRSRRHQPRQGAGEGGAWEWGAGGGGRGAWAGVPSLHGLPLRVDLFFLSYSLPLCKHFAGGGG